MRHRIFFIIIMVIFAVNEAFSQGWPEPKQEAKAGTRWWWLGSAVNEEDLKWNMEEYSRAGIGALEITPLYGVKGNDDANIDFLSDKWMSILGFVEEEGIRDGLYIDMNTGTGWPFGGPEVPLEEAASKLICIDTTVLGSNLCIGIDVSLQSEKEKKYAKLSRAMAYFGDKAIDITQYVDSLGTLIWADVPADSTIRVMAAYCSRTRQQVKRAAPGGSGYVIDHFDHDAVKHYLERFDRAFSQSKTPYPHAFFNDSYEVYKANWTPKMFEEFEKRRGYKLEEHLPELLYGANDGSEQVLVDYRETLSELLLENFTEQWTTWAHSHGVITRNQAHGSPANLIDVYSAVDIPEIESFGITNFKIKGLRTDPKHTIANYSDAIMLKYASSAAHINAKRLVSSETFTWLTEHFRTSLSQMKPDLDQMFACGVNNIYFHGTCYSPRNDEWPGWRFYASVDMSPNNSIWHDAPFLMQYIERCQSFLQMGEPDNDFLVYLPIADMWKKRSGTGESSLLMEFSIHTMGKKSPDFINAVSEILKAGYDCDYISEKYLLRTTFTENELRTAAGVTYKALIIPDGTQLSPVLKAHIDSLKALGAHVIYGHSDSQMELIATPEKMKTQCHLNIIRRKNDLGHHYFIANLTPNDIETRVPLSVNYTDARWFNPLDGAIYAVDNDSNGILIKLRSGESMILRTYSSSLEDNVPLRPTASQVGERELQGPWQLSFTESAPRVDSTFTLNKLQTWELLNDDSIKVTMGTGAYMTHIKMTKKEAKSDWLIDLGDVRESARVYVNDVFVGCAWAVPFTLECHNVFKKGDNTIRIEVTNLPANRIADLDKRGIEWRKFNEINVVDVNYKKTKYDGWAPVESGLNSRVILYPLQYDAK